MKFTIIILGLLVTSCTNWEYTTVEREFEIPKTHVHIYDHNTFEWYCLHLDGGKYKYNETIKTKIK